MKFTDFSKQIKEKYPQYQDVDDKLLAEKMIEKYPTYKEQVEFDSGVVDIVKKGFRSGVTAVKEKVSQDIETIKDVATTDPERRKQLLSDAGQQLKKGGKAGALGIYDFVTKQAPKMFSTTASILAGNKLGIGIGVAGQDFLTYEPEILKKKRKEAVQWADDITDTIAKEEQERMVELGITEDTSIFDPVNFGYKLASGASSMGLAVGLSIFTKNPMLGASALGWLEGSDTYNRSKDKLAESHPEWSEDDIHRRALINASVDSTGIAMLEKVGLDYLFRSYSGGKLYKASINAITETAQETAQTVWSNLVAKFGYDKTQKIFEDVGETIILTMPLGFFGGGIIPSGSADTQIIEPPKEVVDDVIKKTGLSEEEAKEVISKVTTIVDEDVKNVPSKIRADELKEDIKEQLSTGKTKNQVILELSKEISTKEATNIVNEVSKTDVEGAKIAVEETGEALGDIAKELDKTLLDSDFVQLRQDIQAGQDELQTEVETLTQKIGVLKEEIASAKTGSNEKKVSKKKLAVEQAKLRRVEKKLKDETVGRVDKTRSIIGEYITKDLSYAPENLDDLIDDIFVASRQPVNIGKPIRAIVANQVIVAKKGVETVIKKKEVEKKAEVETVPRENVKLVGKKAVRALPEKRIYAKGASVIKGTYEGKPYTTNTFIMEFADLKGVVEKGAKVPSSEAIQSLVGKLKGATPLGEIKHFTDANGIKGAVFGLADKEVTLDVDYYNYFLKKFPDMELKGTGDTSPVGVYSKGKLVGLIMPVQPDKAGGLEKIPVAKEKEEKREVSKKKEEKPKEKIEETPEIKFKLKTQLEDSPAFKEWFGDSKVVDEKGEPLTVFHGGYGDITSFSHDFAGMTTANNEGEGFYFSNEEQVAEDYSEQSILRRYEDRDIDDLSYFEELSDKQREKIIEDVYDYAMENTKVVSVYLRMENPLIVEKFSGGVVDTLETQEYVKFAKGEAVENITEIEDDIGIENMYEYDRDDVSDYMEDIEQRSLDNYDKKYSELDRYEKEQVEFEVLDENGLVSKKEYDGVIFKNVVDDIGDKSALYQDVYVVFNPNQIKSIDNKGGFSLYSDNIFLKKKTFKEDKKTSTYAIKEAQEYLEGVKKRLNIDFDIQYVNAIYSGKERGIFGKMYQKEAYGLFTDNTIVLMKEMASRTAEHETVHLTLANLEKISAFKGMTREEILKAQAEKMGLKYDELSEEDKLKKVEEGLALDFEKYIDEKHKPKGIIKRFFEALKEILQKFSKTIIKTDGDIIKDYFDILSEGEAVEGEMVRLESKGIVKAYMEDGGIFNIDNKPKASDPNFFPFVNVHFKEKTGDKRLIKLETEYNKLSDKQEKIEQNIIAWRTHLEFEILNQARLAKVVEETAEDVKGLARFTKRTPPVGELTTRGITEKRNFADPKKAEEEMRQYLYTKAQIKQNRKELSALRKSLASARKNKKTEARTMREIGRKLKLRKQNLERNGYYTELGLKRGKKEQMKMIWKRGRILREIQEGFVIGDKKAKDIVAGRKIHLMSNKEFEDFMLYFSEKAEEMGRTLDAQTVAKALIQESEQVAGQSIKWENLRKSMGLPPLSTMTEEEANRFVDALERYQIGDVFLSQRMIETMHRTNWGAIKTEREMSEKMQEVMGFGFEDIKGELTGATIWTPWVRLARKHPFYNWLVSRRISAKIQEEKEYYEIEKNINELITKARASRRKLSGLKGKLIDVIIPQDKLIAGYIEAENKGDYLTKNPLTKEELAFIDYWNTLSHGAYEYLQTERGMRGRKNYMTHIRRSFLEALRESGIKPALREIITSQKENEAVFKIIDEDTGNILAYEKFNKFTLQRSGDLIPSKNLAKSSLAYFRMFARMRALDGFVPEALLAVKAHEMVVGKTDRGLTKDASFNTFVNKFINDAKGRKIPYLGVKQASTEDVALRSLVSWVAYKYLGLKLASAIASFVGDFVMAFVQLPVTVWKREGGLAFFKSLPRAVYRSFTPTGHEVVKKYRFFTGRNPLVELFDPQYNIPAKIIDTLLILFSLSNFQSNKFFLRGVMTPEEWSKATIESEELTKLAKDLSRVKLNSFYIKSLLGNTTFGSTQFQFGTWALPVFNSLVSDLQEGVKKLAKVKDTKKWEDVPKEELIFIATFTIQATIAVALASLFTSEDDDEDKGFWATLLKRAKRELTTLTQAIQFASDPSNYFLAMKELMLWVELVKQIASQERYKRDGKGYGIGDLKATRTFKRVITPSVIGDFFPEEERDTKMEMIDEAVKTGVFEPEKIAELIFGDDWVNEQKETRSDEKQAEYKEKKIGELTKLYNIKKNYPENVLAGIILEESNNDARVAKIIEYAKKVGVDRASKELKDLYKDRNICVNPRKKTGCLVSNQLFKDFIRAKKKL